MPGVQRRQTVQVKKETIEQAEEKKIKFDVYNNIEEEETPDYTKKTNKLDNVIKSMLTDLQEDMMAKPVMLKTSKTTKKLMFFDDDDE